MERSYYSCGVFGCLYTTRNSDYTFFKCPNNIERRNLWLTLIDRDDIKNKWSTRLRVCEAHFETDSLLKTSNRTLLKKGSVPRLLLPVKKQENKESQTTVETTEKCTQYDKDQRNSYSQTPAYLSANTPQIRKLKQELLECRKRLKAAEKLDMFHKLCDKYLNENLSKVVKEQAKFKFHSPGNRYSTEYKIFCLDLFYRSPQAYLMLSESLLKMPSKTTLKRMYSRFLKISGTAVLKARKLQIGARRASCPPCTAEADDDDDASSLHSENMDASPSP